MGDRTGIEWTDATWNPVTGCTKVSPGCDHCYAETIAHRFAGTKAYPQGFDVTLWPTRLDQPLRWKRPRRVFVNSMSDLFHDDIPDEYIAKVWAVMAAARQHTFQVLTKRHGRLRSLLSSGDFSTLLAKEYLNLPRDQRGGSYIEYPLPNVWLGVSVENQAWADIRVPALLDTPAAVRFLSMEPLLGPVSIMEAIRRRPVQEFHHLAPSIDWVIVGGESGRHARPMHPSWVRAIRDEVVGARVPFHFKQWGEWLTTETATGAAYDLVGKKAAGRELDGRTWDEFPGVTA